jgi:hypothetical protein
MSLGLLTGDLHYTIGLKTLMTAKRQQTTPVCVWEKLLAEFDALPSIGDSESSLIPEIKQLLNDFEERLDGFKGSVQSNYNDFLLYGPKSSRSLQMKGQVVRQHASGAKSQTFWMAALIRSGVSGSNCRRSNSEENKRFLGPYRRFRGSNSACKRQGNAP